MKTIEVAAAVIRKGSLVFATQRGYGAFKDGWEVPGGKIEPGETKENALIREIQEELNTTIRIEQFIQTVECDYPGFHLIMHCFLCSVVNGNLEIREHEDFKWVTLDTLDTLEWLPADRLVLPALKECILKEQNFRN